jgi:hypothetical protein
MNHAAFEPALPLISYNGVNLINWTLERDSEDSWCLLDIPPAIANMTIEPDQRDCQWFPEPVPGACVVTWSGTEMDDTMCDFSTECISDQSDPYQEGVFVYADIKWREQHWDLNVVVRFPHNADQRLSDGHVMSFNLCRTTDN